MKGDVKMKMNDAKIKMEATIMLLKMKYRKRYVYKYHIFRDGGLLNVYLEIADDWGFKKRISSTAISYAKSCMALAGFGNFHVVHRDHYEDIRIPFVDVYAKEQKGAA